MAVTSNELWTIIHGMTLGAIFLLAFSGGIAELYALRPEWETNLGMSKAVRRMRIGMWLLVIAVWAAVFTGAFIVYPWYRAAAPQGADLALFPKALLLASESTAGWHEFGMEWKEHVAWIAPMAATVVAYVVWVYGTQLSAESKIRRALMWFFAVAFVTAGIAGMFGAFITKAAPLH
jgi:hypothetical protein